MFRVPLLPASCNEKYKIEFYIQNMHWITAGRDAITNSFNMTQTENHRSIVKVLRPVVQWYAISDLPSSVLG